MRRRDFFGLVGGLGLLSGCAAAGWGSRDEDVFFDLRTGERLGRADVLRRMVTAPIVLLGEVHDSASHHRIRASLLLEWVRSVRGRPAAIVFEQLDREYNDALGQAQRLQSASAAPGHASLDGRTRTIALLDAAGFNRKAWGWPAHLPLFEAAQASGAKWIAANFSRASAQQLSRNPDAPVDPVLQAVLESARWSRQAQQSLAQALRQGHCNALPESAVITLARLQRIRDAALALPLLDANERRTALIAGNGHVRRDHGVPLYLGAYEHEALVFGFEEVPAQRTSQGDLAGFVGAARAADLQAGYDLVCLTPHAQAARDTDPCADFDLARPGIPAINPATPTQTPSR